MTTVYTVGHGTRTSDELARIVRGAGVRRVFDVRRFPGSRRYPHFARQALERSLPDVGVSYEWRGEALGGRRAPLATSRHGALRVAGFRSFADHMDTPAFRDALTALEADATTGAPVAIMCAETLWWRCHRRLISDALVVDGFDVVHLVDAGTTQTHALHPNARVDNGTPVYDIGATTRVATLRQE
jgi:uncharacterized protein (DUF488 family)